MVNKNDLNEIYDVVSQLATMTELLAEHNIRPNSYSYEAIKYSQKLIERAKKAYIKILKENNL